MNSVGRTSKAYTRGCFAKKFYDLPEANLSYTKERLKNGVLPDKLACLGIGFVPPGGGMEADAGIYEVVEWYLNGLIPELNFRLFCDVELEYGHFPQKILWVEKITMLVEENGDMVCGRREKNCLEERRLEDGKESAFAGQIKYIVEKIKDYFMTLWKKKGR